MAGAGLKIDLKLVDNKALVVLDRIAGGGGGDDSRAIKRIWRAMFLSAQELRNNAILGMQNTPKTGHKYKRGTHMHIASSAGNYPAIDTGALLRSIMVDDRRSTGEIEIGSSIGMMRSSFGKKNRGDLNYPLFLEMGVKGGMRSKIRMKPRPWMTLTMKESKPKIQRAIASAIRAITKGNL